MWQDILKYKSQTRNEFRVMAREIIFKFIEDKDIVNVTEILEHVMKNIKQYALDKYKPEGAEKAKWTRGANSYIKKLQGNPAYISKLLKNNGFAYYSRNRIGGDQISMGTLYKRI